MSNGYGDYDSGGGGYNRSSGGYGDRPPHRGPPHSQGGFQDQQGGHGGYRGPHQQPGHNPSSGGFRGQSNSGGYGSSGGYGNPPSRPSYGGTLHPPSGPSYGGGAPSSNLGHGYGSAPPPPPSAPAPVYGGGAPTQYQSSSALPPMPNPTDPSYPQWYKQWYDMYGHSLRSQQQPPHTPSTPAPPPCPPPSRQPGYAPGPPPAKTARLDLGSAPPPPPPKSDGVGPVAAKKGAVIYTTPRPPTPEHLKRKIPEKEMKFPLEDLGPQVPQLSGDLPFRPPSPEPVEPAKPKMDWFYDGQSWVYADKQPEKKPPSKEQVKTAEKIFYTYAGEESPVQKALINSLRGRYPKDPNKPKAVPGYCEVCNLSVSCQQTLQVHLAGKNHKKREVQVERQKKEDERHEAARMKLIEKEAQKVKNAVAGKTMQDLGAVTGVKIEPGIKLEPAVKLEPDMDQEDNYIVMMGSESVCTLCDARMNSAEMVNAHLTGRNHNKKVNQNRGGVRGRGRSASYVSSFSSRGGSHANRGGRVPVPIPRQSIQQDMQKKVSDARAEYDRILEQALAQNINEEVAQEQALEAMNAYLSNDGQSSEDAPGNSAAAPGKVTPSGMAATLADIKVKVEKGELEMADSSEATTGTSNSKQWPPPNVTIVIKPRGFKPGTYRCELCEVTLASEPILEAHLNSPAHKEEEAKPPSLRRRNQGKVFTRRYAVDGLVKAQRGRRGLISSGEVMPMKMTKSERRDEADIAKSIEKHLAKQTGETKVLPLLMNFVKGGTIIPD